MQSLHSLVLKFSDPTLVKKIQAGGIGVMPTDTLYGLVGRALSRSVVKQIYRLRKRDRNKPFIVLISSFMDLRACGVVIDKKTRIFLSRVWPGKVSVILPCISKRFHFLHRGTKTIAFRMPRPPRLRALLKKAGPLVAPSANLQGLPPATTIQEAKAYFGNRVDFYVDQGRLRSLPSTLIGLENGTWVVRRQGASRLPAFT